MKRPNSGNATVFNRLAALYTRMDTVYAETASQVDFTCAGCPENCCVSYFQHHTYVEWAFLWVGMNELPPARREVFLERAHENVDQCRTALSIGLRPRAMCPLNEAGRCQLYHHRLMICRLHGTAHTAPRPDGAQVRYPGCFRFEAATVGSSAENMPVLDRLPLYRELALLEMAFLGRKVRTLPKVSLTLSEMLTAGPPRMVGA